MPAGGATAPRRRVLVEGSEFSDTELSEMLELITYVTASDELTLFGTDSQAQDPHRGHCVALSSNGDGKTGVAVAMGIAAVESVAALGAITELVLASGRSEGSRRQGSSRAYDWRPLIHWARRHGVETTLIFPRTMSDIGDWGQRGISLLAGADRWILLASRTQAQVTHQLNAEDAGTQGGDVDVHLLIDSDNVHLTELLAIQLLHLASSDGPLVRATAFMGMTRDAELDSYLRLIDVRTDRPDWDQVQAEAADIALAVTAADLVCTADPPVRSRLWLAAQDFDYLPLLRWLRTHDVGTSLMHVGPVHSLLRAAAEHAVPLPAVVPNKGRPDSHTPPAHPALARLVTSLIPKSPLERRSVLEVVERSLRGTPSAAIDEMNQKLLPIFRASDCRNPAATELLVEILAGGGKPPMLAREVRPRCSPLVRYQAGLVRLLSPKIERLGVDTAQTEQWIAEADLAWRVGVCAALLGRRRSPVLRAMVLQAVDDAMGSDFIPLETWAVI